MGTKRANKMRNKTEKVEQKSVLEKLKEGLSNDEIDRASKVAKTHKGRLILAK